MEIGKDTHELDKGMLMPPLPAVENSEQEEIQEEIQEKSQEKATSWFRRKNNLKEIKRE